MFCAVYTADRSTVRTSKVLAGRLGGLAADAAGLHCGALLVPCCGNPAEAS